MNENADNSALVPLNAELLTEGRKNSSSISERNERTDKEVTKIRDLDAAIREMERELKMVRAETFELQSKNRKELKKKLSPESRVGGFVAKNTQRFLELFDEREFCGKPESEFYATNEPEAALSITDEEKRRINLLTDEGDFDRDESNADDRASSNPYSIDESSKQFLNELKKKFDNNCNDEAKVF